MANHSWLIAHFSPTGTTVKVARAIAQGAPWTAREVDLSAPVEAQTVGPDEVLLAAMPVFGGRVPAVALERLAQLKGSGQKAVAVVVYGNRAYDDALLELSDALEENGFQVLAAAAFIAEHSIVRSIAAGRPDQKDLALASEFGAMASKKAGMESQTGGVETAKKLPIPGNSGYRDKKKGGSGAHPSAAETCIKCGVCANSCPVGAIPPEDPSQTDPQKCINCGRCVKICPENARFLPKTMLLAVEGMLKMTASKPKQPELFI